MTDTVMVSGSTSTMQQKCEPVSVVADDEPTSALLHTIGVSTALPTVTQLSTASLPSAAASSEEADMHVEVPRRLKRSRSSVEDEVIQLQQQTLAGVQQLVTIQQHMLEMKKMKLELKREMVAMKRTEMVKNGMVQGEDGSWMIVVHNTEE